MFCNVWKVSNIYLSNYGPDLAVLVRLFDSNLYMLEYYTLLGLVNLPSTENNGYVDYHKLKIQP